MYTRCPECETTFRLGANDLRRAQGKVRCGECSRVFNALEYLAEDEDVEAETGKEWPIEPANDALADTIIDRAPGLHDTPDEETAGDDFAGADGPIGAPDENSELQTDADADHGPDHEPDNNAADRWSADSSREPAEAEDDFDYKEFLLDEAEDDFTPEENSAVTDERIEPGEGLDEGSVDSPAGDRAEPPLGSLTADEDDAEDDEPVLFIDGDEDDDEIEDEPTDDLTTEDGPTLFQPDVESDEDEEAAESDVIQPAEDTGAGLAAEEDEFDDTIWERIPGVGSITSPTDAVSQSDDNRYISESERSYSHEGDWLSEDSARSASEEDAEDTLSEDETATKPEDDDAADFAGSMEFNAPKDKWSSIFASTASWQKEAEEEPVSFIADEADWDATTVDDDVEEEEVSEPANDPTSGLYATRDEVDAEIDEATDVRDDDLAEPDETEADEDVWEIVADDDAEDGAEEGSDEWAESIQASLSTSGTVDEPLAEEDADAPVTEPEEPPAEGYDVQHIVLPDESEPPEEKPQADTPSWRPEAYAEQPERRANTTRWLLGSLAMITLLGLQLVHYNRDSLATNTAWGPTVRDTYARLGLDLYPEWSIGDYEIRGSEAVAGESGPDVMDIRAQIAAVGRTPVGLPYLRVILRDRWSNPVAAKHFSPTEYAQDKDLPADMLMQPNSTINAHVSIADPGSGAQGFELELCLPRRHSGMDCSGKPFR